VRVADVRVPGGLDAREHLGAERLPGEQDAEDEIIV
jgi:hypothetical protein